MDGLSKWKIILGIIYVVTALGLFGIVYALMLKRFKRNKLSAMNAISLLTSKNNIFSQKTQFLVISPESCEVRIDLLDRDEKLVETLVNESLTEDEFPFDFDPAKYESGKYYLYLTTENANILRSITIVK